MFALQKKDETKCETGIKRKCEKSPDSTESEKNSFFFLVFNLRMNSYFV